MKKNVGRSVFGRNFLGAYTNKMLPKLVWVQQWTFIIYSDSLECSIYLKHEQNF